MVAAIDESLPTMRLREARMLLAARANNAGARQLSDTAGRFSPANGLKWSMRKGVDGRAHRAIRRLRSSSPILSEDLLAEMASQAQLKPWKAPEHASPDCFDH